MALVGRIRDALVHILTTERLRLARGVTDERSEGAREVAFTFAKMGMRCALVINTTTSRTHDLLLRPLADLIPCGSCMVVAFMPSDTPTAFISRTNRATAAVAATSLSSLLAFPSASRSAAAAASSTDVVATPSAASMRRPKNSARETAASLPDGSMSA
jgi:hypothetical protein